MKNMVCFVLIFLDISPEANGLKKYSPDQKIWSKTDQKTSKFHLLKCDQFFFYHKHEFSNLEIISKSCARITSVAFAVHKI